MEDVILFDIPIRKIGGSYYALVPPAIAEYLSIEEGTPCKGTGIEKSKGRFLAVWKVKKGR